MLEQDAVLPSCLSRSPASVQKCWSHYHLSHENPPITKDPTKVEKDVTLSNTLSTIVSWESLSLNSSKLYPKETAKSRQKISSKHNLSVYADSIVFLLKQEERRKKKALYDRTTASSQDRHFDHVYGRPSSPSWGSGCGRHSKANATDSGDAPEAEKKDRKDTSVVTAGAAITSTLAATKASPSPPFVTTKSRQKISSKHKLSAYADSIAFLLKQEERRKKKALYDRTTASSQDRHFDHVYGRPSSSSWGRGGGRHSKANATDSGGASEAEKKDRKHTSVVTAGAAIASTLAATKASPSPPLVATKSRQKISYTGGVGVRGEWGRGRRRGQGGITAKAISISCSQSKTLEGIQHTQSGTEARKKTQLLPRCHNGRTLEDIIRRTIIYVGEFTVEVLLQPNH